MYQKMYFLYFRRIHVRKLDSLIWQLFCNLNRWGSRLWDWDQHWPPLTWAAWPWQTAVRTSLVGSGGLCSASSWTAQSAVWCAARWAGCLASPPSAQNLCGGSCKRYATSCSAWRTDYSSLSPLPAGNPSEVVENKKGDNLQWKLEHLWVSNVYRALEAVKYFVVFIIQHTRGKVNPVLILSK